jgi:hypothetical protein
MTNKNTDWLKVYSTGQPHLAALAQQALENDGVEAVQMNQKDSSYLFGQIDIMVEKSNMEKAEKIIARFKTDLDIE